MSVGGRVHVSLEKKLENRPKLVLFWGSIPYTNYVLCVCIHYQRLLVIMM